MKAQRAYAWISHRSRAGGASVRAGARAAGRAAVLALSVWVVPAVAASAPLVADGWTRLATPVFEHPSLGEHTAVAAVAQADDGVMWFGTTAGLVRFDGYRVRLYDTTRPLVLDARDLSVPGPDEPAPDAAVSALLPLPGGGVLVGTAAAGLLRFDPQRDALERLPCLACGQALRVTDLAPAADGGVWVAGDDGVDHILPATAHARHLTLPAVLASSRTFAVLEDARRTLWVGGHPGLYVRPPGAAGFRRMLPADGASAQTRALLAGDITSLYQDAGGGIWVGGREGLVARLDPAGARPLPFPGEAELTAWLRGRAVTGFLQPDPRREPGLIWIATDGAGIVTLDTRTGASRRLFHDPARATTLSSDTVHRMALGRAGNVWVTTGDGVNRYAATAGGVTTVQRATPGLPGLSGACVLSILTDSRRQVWLGMAGGTVDRLDPATGAIRPVLLPGPAGTRDVTALVELPDGAILAGSRGVARIDPRTLAVQAALPALDDEMVTSLAVQGGRLDVGTPDGLIMVDLASGRATRPRDAPRGRVDALLPAADGGLWLGGRLGLGLLRPPVGGSAGWSVGGPAGGKDATVVDAGTVVPVPLRRDPPPDGGGPARVSVSVLAAGGDGSLLLGTREGEVGVVTGGGADGGILHPALSPSRRALGKQRGVMSLLADDAGRLWGTVDDAIFLSHAGFDHFDIFGRRQGALAGAYNPGAAAFGPGGELLFGGQNGLTIVRPGRLPSLATVEGLAITAVAVNHTVRLDLVPRPGGGLDLAQGMRALRLDFALLDYRYPADLHYAYRLDGFDHVWLPCPGLPEANYTNLPPGDYVFRVRAWEAAADSPLAEMSFPVTVAAYWYETTWFHILVAFGVLAAVALLVAWRTEVYRHRQAELARIVGERTRDLKDANQKLLRLAGTDSLTGILNRRRFFELAEAEHQRSLRYGRIFSLILMDLDHFKAINDTHGHVAGDAVLRHVVSVAVDMSRMMDLMGRYGGEEMIFLLPETGVEGALTVAERIREKLAASPLLVNGRLIPVTASLGVAQWSGPGGGDTGRAESLAALIDRADQALYRAKHLGRNRTVLAPGAGTGEGADDAAARPSGQDNVSSDPDSPDAHGPSDGRGQAPPSAA